MFPSSELKLCVVKWQSQIGKIMGFFLASVIVNTVT
jgi:hypothetical protein